MKLVYAVTAHGFGHWTRSAAILNALGRLVPGVEWIVAGGVDEGIVSRSLTLPHTRAVRSYEPGAIQKNCFEVDEAATRAAYAQLFEHRDARLADEVAFLRQNRARAVLSDIAALPVRAAAELGLPAIGISNFTWDWVLEPMFAQTGAEGVIRRLAEDYAGGTRHLLFPLGQRTSPFQRLEGAPIVSRRARLGAREVREVLGFPDDGRALVLVCAGGWSADDWQSVHVPGCDGYRFVTVGDLPITFDAPSVALSHALPDPVTFPDLVNISACVVAKPGYGIASECLVHRTPMLAIDRPGFRETPPLLADCASFGPTWALSMEDFFAGDWEASIRGLLASPTPWGDVPTDGAEQVARRVAELLSL